MATARLTKAAAAVARGVDAERALIEAGYGAAFAAGFAKSLPALLAKLGLSSGRAAKAAPAPAPKEA